LSSQQRRGAPAAPAENAWVRVVPRPTVGSPRALRGERHDLGIPRSMAYNRGSRLSLGDACFD